MAPRVRRFRSTKPAAALQRIIGSFAPSLTFTATPQQFALRVSQFLGSTPDADGNYTWKNETNFHS
jgi:hypothetical protein